MRAANSTRIFSAWRAEKPGSLNGVIVRLTPSAATESRIESNRLEPTATRTAARAGPAALSIAGLSAVAIIWRVRSPRGPSSRKSPIRSRVTTSSAMIRA